MRARIREVAALKWRIILFRITHVRKMLSIVDDLWRSLQVRDISVALFSFISEHFALLIKPNLYTWDLCFATTLVCLKYRLFLNRSHRTFSK